MRKKRWVLMLATMAACSNGSDIQGVGEPDADALGSSGGQGADASASVPRDGAAADTGSASRIGDADATFTGPNATDASLDASGSSSPNGRDASADSSDDALPDGGNADAGPMGPFAGSWSCPYQTNSGYMGSTPFVFTQNADGTLTSSSMIEFDACTLQWTVSGSTATAVVAATCGGFTVDSYTFQLEQGQPGVAFAMATAVEHGVTFGPDGGAIPIDLAGSFAGFCTKDGTGDGGTPIVCEQDPVVGCGGGSVGYLCLGTYSPQTIDPAISCGELFIGGSSCCTLGSSGDP